MTDKPKNKYIFRLVILASIALCFGSLVFYYDKIHNDFYPNFLKKTQNEDGVDNSKQNIDQAPIDKVNEIENEIKTKLLDYGPGEDVEANDQSKKLVVNKAKQERYLNTLKAVNDLIVKFSVNENYLVELAQLNNNSVPSEVQELFAEMDEYAKKYLNDSKVEQIFPKQGVLDSLVGNVVTIEKKNYIKANQKSKYHEIASSLNILTDYYFSIKYQNHVVFND